MKTKPWRGCRRGHGSVHMSRHKANGRYHCIYFTTSSKKPFGKTCWALQKKARAAESPDAERQSREG